MLFPFLIPLALSAVNSLAEGSACKQVTSSECEPAANIELDVASEADCRAFCDLYDSSGIGCTFSAWAQSALSNNCRLYALPFSQFLKSCKVLAGPPDLNGCNVEHPEDNTCDVIRDGDCFYHGDLLESDNNLDSWESCEAYCSLSPDCEAWTFRAEPSLECRLLATDDRKCVISYFPSGLDPDDCGQAGTSTTTVTAPTTTAKAGQGILVVGGSGAFYSAEVWSPGYSCRLPKLPTAMVMGPTVDILQGLPTVCFETACYQPTRAGWLHFQDTLHSRTDHTSAVLEEGLLLVGGYDSRSTTELLPVDGGAAKEGFSLSPSRSHHCSIQVSTTTIILSGGESCNPVKVSEHSNLSGEVTTRQLPNHITGRSGHACTFYTVGQSQVLIVAGGAEMGDGDRLLASTELLDYSSPAGEWREAGQLPSPRTGLRAAKLGQAVYLTGGIEGSTMEGSFTRDVLSWDQETESWSKAGDLSWEARAYHGVTEVSLAAAEDYCTVL